MAASNGVVGVRGRVIVSALALVFVASAATAQSLSPAAQVSPTTVVLTQPLIDLSARRPEAAVDYGPHIVAKGPFQGRTAVDHRFSPDGVVGSVGYLCGIDGLARDGEGGAGPASTFGHQGTFLGASLGYAFK
jgi:hypothetical protein